MVLAGAVLSAEVLFKGVLSAPGVVFSKVKLVGTHLVQTVLVLVFIIVDVVWIVLMMVLLSEVMVCVTGHVVKVV